MRKQFYLSILPFAILSFGFVSSAEASLFEQSYGFGNSEDEYLVGDWDGDGRDNLAVRRGSATLMDYDYDGLHDLEYNYGFGNEEDGYLVGDWDGDGTDDLAVRRGSATLMDYDYDSLHDLNYNYGFGNDEDGYLVGDWDGDGIDNLAVRRGRAILMDYDFDGFHNLEQVYGQGNAEDEYMVGDWDGDGRDNLAVRRGNLILFDTNFDSSTDLELVYGRGNNEDGYLVGDWDGDGRDTIAVRRGNVVLELEPLVTPPPVLPDGPMVTAVVPPPTVQIRYPNLTGAFIELEAGPMQPGLWTRIQWQDAGGGWHDIEGWQGSFSPDQRVLWYVSQEHMGDGPFRWLVYESQGGDLLTMSQPFDLPSGNGEVLQVGVSLANPSITQSAAKLPEAVIPTQSPVVDTTPAQPETPRLNSFLSDNFDDPTYDDGRYNSTIWTQKGGCADAAQSEGVITFQSTCDLVAQPTSVAFDELDMFEAQVQVASDHNGETVVTQEILFFTNDLPGEVWWVTCGIRAEDTGVSTFLHVFNKGNAGDDMYLTSPAEYDRWYTIRLEVDRDTLTFSCFVDDTQLLGSFIPQDTALLQEARFERILEAARAGTAFGTTAVNYVRLTDSSPNEAEETAWFVNPENNHAYRMIGCGSWLVCKNAAATQDAHLVTINSESEQLWLAGTFGESALFWIGFTDQGSEGDWEWSNGETVTYTNWGQGEPNDGWACGEDFGVLNWVQARKWNDLGPCLPEWEYVVWAIIEQFPR